MNLPIFPASWIDTRLASVNWLLLEVQVSAEQLHVLTFFQDARAGPDNYSHLHAVNIYRGFGE